MILPEELHEIRRIWLTERGDWEDSVPRIYNDVTSETLAWVKDDAGEFGSRELALLQEICAKYEIPREFIQKLLDAELQTQGMNKRASIFKRIDQILSEEWRDEDEVRREVLGDLIKKKAVTLKASQELFPEIESAPTESREV